ncbi:ethanolamine permease [Pedobacter frigidisoli]|uniref:ethanolamine permease n=1 Tax=Pedobacter frigidisoli TaxID=2530455 RepID=UPI00292D18EA|nr:ethanolamine permease [Pedobacter frigidisoli]
MKDSQTLKKTLSATHLWAIGVGLVISGDYFGWNYGWGVAGTVGLLLATVIISILYITFIFSFTELSTAIPSAGGPFSYSLKAFGVKGGLIAGYATLVEFLFAAPAISMALGSYIHFLYPSCPALAVSIASFLVFTGINLLGLKEAAWFSLVMTVLAIAELLIFIFIAAPHFKIKTFMHNPLPFGFGGVFSALPFAIWLFVCLEGIAMVAEEVKNGNKAIARGYISALITLIILAFAVMICVGGIAPWQELDNLDYPLPESLGIILGRDSKITRLFAGVGLFGLIASFHGIIISYSRQIFALSRAGYLPKALSWVSRKRKTPYVALFLGTALGISALMFFDTGKLVILSTIGAVVVYIISMLSLFKLRKSEPDMNRPFRAPFYPYFPAIALTLAAITLVSMVYGYPALSGIFLIGLVICFAVLLISKKMGNNSIGIEEAENHHQHEL